MGSLGQTQVLRGQRPVPRGRVTLRALLPAGPGNPGKNAQPDFSHRPALHPVSDQVWGRVDAQSHLFESLKRPVSGTNVTGSLGESPVLLWFA